MKKTKKTFSFYSSGEERIVKVEGRDVWDAFYKADKLYKYVRRPNQVASTGNVRRFYKKNYSRKARKIQGTNARSIRILSRVYGWASHRYGVFEPD